MTVLSAILAHKWLFFFIVAGTALLISTIALGVEVSQLKTALSEEEKKHSDDAESSTVTTSSTTTSSTTTSSTTTSSTTTSSTTTSSTTTSSTTTSSTTKTPEPTMSKYRLPSAVKPILYDLHLYPDLESGLFKGTVIVSIAVSKATNSIVIHNNGLSITNVTVDSVEANFSLDSEYESVIITRKDGADFTTSTDSMSIAFNGDMKNRIVGLYTSSYTSAEGNITTTSLFGLGRN